MSYNFYVLVLVICHCLPAHLIISHYHSVSSSLSLPFFPLSLSPIIMTASCWASSIKHPPFPHCVKSKTLVTGLRFDKLESLRLHFWGCCPWCCGSDRGSRRTCPWRRRCRWSTSRSWWTGRWTLWTSGCRRSQTAFGASLKESIVILNKSVFIREALKKLFFFMNNS